ncbi:MAG TPA: metallopeptidase TldD-related protein [Polyangia bacterium]|jgi:predicted Zn-dependent protease|nr:metallopeptidase TldD-related protein [Polyangia bacterium]
MERPLDEESARAAVKAAFEAVTADDVRVNIGASERAFLRYAVNEVTTSGQVTDADTEVTCAVGAKHASVSIHGVRPADVAAAARHALELARVAPDDPEFVPSPGVATMKPVPAAWSDAPVTADDRAALAADAIAEAKKHQLIGYGFVQHERATAVTATRRGFFGIHHETGCDATTTARTPNGDGSGWACAGAVAFKDVDLAGAARIACEKALRSRAAKPLEPGVYPVVLEPAAVAGLLAMISFEQRQADEGRSVFSKSGGGSRVGDKMLGALTLRSDPWNALMPSEPFDNEGMPRPPITWVDGGTLKKLHTSRYWAKKTARPADARYRTMVPSGPRADTMDALVAGLERGLLVTRLWYIRSVEPQTATVTGLTRDGVFLVDKGKVVGPVNNFRFNQSVTQMFADTEAWGAPVRVSGEGGYPLVAPAIRCKAFRMSSKSDAV